MKLIICPACSDIVAMRDEPRTCACGASHGHYTDQQNAVYGGKAIPMGIANGSLRDALLMRRAHGVGYNVEAFVIAKDCATFKQEICDA